MLMPATAMFIVLMMLENGTIFYRTFLPIFSYSILKRNKGLEIWQD